MLTFLLAISDEKDHDKIAFIYNNYHDKMIRLARYRLAKAGLPNFESEAEDAVENAYLKIVKYIDAINFDASEKELKAYVLSVVANETINVMRNIKLFDDIDECDEILSDDNFMERIMISDRYDRVIKAIESMDGIYSIALLYRFCKGYSVKEMSELLGVKEKTMYTRIARAQRILLNLLEGDGEI